MAGKVHYWTFSDAVDRDSQSPYASDGDVGVTLDDGAWWRFHAPTSKWIPFRGIREPAPVGPHYGAVHDQTFRFTHTPSGSSLVYLPPVFFEATDPTLYVYGGWIRLHGVVVWDDGSGTLASRHFAIEGEFGLGGVNAPVIMRGLMRPATPGTTDYGAMRVAAVGTQLRLQLRDWNDSFQRLYVGRYEVSGYDGVSP